MSASLPVRSHHLDAPSPPEIMVERRGLGLASWWWRLTRDGETVLAASKGFRGAEDAYDAARTVLGHGRKRA